MDEELRVFLAYSTREMIDAAKGDVDSMGLVSCHVASFLKYAREHRLTDDEKAVLKGMLETLITATEKHL